MPTFAEVPTRRSRLRRVVGRSVVGGAIGLAVMAGWSATAEAAPSAPVERESRGPSLLEGLLVEVGGAVDGLTGGLLGQPTAAEPEAAATTDPVPEPVPADEPAPTPVPTATRAPALEVDRVTAPVGATIDRLTRPGSAVGAVVRPVVDEVAGPLLDELVDQVSPVTEPVLAPVGSVLEPVSPVVSELGPVLAGVDPFLDPVVDLFSPILAPMLEIADPVVDPLAPILAPVTDDVDATQGGPDVDADEDGVDIGADRPVLPIGDPAGAVEETSDVEGADAAHTGGVIGVVPMGSAPPLVPGPVVAEHGGPVDGGKDLAASTGSSERDSVDDPGRSEAVEMPVGLPMGSSPAPATIGAGSPAVSAGDLAVSNQGSGLASAAVACAVVLTLASRPRRAPSARPGFSPD